MVPKNQSSERQNKTKNIELVRGWGLEKNPGGLTSEL